MTITARSALRSFSYRARSRRRHRYCRCWSVSNGSSIRSIMRTAAPNRDGALHFNRALRPQPRHGRAEFWAFPAPHLTFCTDERPRKTRRVLCQFNVTRFAATSTTADAWVTAPAVWPSMQQRKSGVRCLVGFIVFVARYSVTRRRLLRSLRTIAPRTRKPVATSRFHK